jgi:hypothetical protein
LKRRKLAMKAVRTNFFAAQRKEIEEGRRALSQAQEENPSRRKPNFKLP